MAAEKRYYWLKLKNDFFSQKEIKKLRKIAGGDTYTIIYLKMQLHSLQNGGKLYYDGFEDNFAEELALEIDEDAENVKITLLFLQKHGLIEQSNESEYLLPVVESNSGSETSSAIRVRRYREKEKTLQCNGSVTPVKQIVNGEIEIEKEIDIEIELEKEIEGEKQDVTHFFKEFIKLRKENGVKTSDKQEEMLLQKLNTIGKNNIEKIDILKNSIINCWKDIYPLNNKKIDKSAKERMKDWINEEKQREVKT